MNFSDFSLNESLAKGIAEASYVECTPVQEEVLKNSLEGRDLYVQSQTGTGKTAAYLISIIQEMLARPESSGKKALIMVPTRELAVQVEEETNKLIKFSTLKCASFYGGVGYDKQVAALKNGIDIMIGTPGRVIDLHEGNQMKFDDVAFLVIDEADRMFDMGFYPDLRTLIKVLPASEKRQTMLFSATLNSYVKNLAWEYTRNPYEITIAAENVTVDEIDQELLHVSSDDKFRLLLGIISREKPESLIIFCNTKRICEIIAKRLKINGFNCDYIIGDLPQSKRLAIMSKFKDGKIKCLVATDVAARGIDVNDLAMVINYDLPNEAENYVHRIGRTARAGKSGKAYTLCSEQDVYSLPAIERYIEKSIPCRVADESLMAEDKSRDIKIHTDSHHEERHDRSDYGKKRNAEYNKNKNRGTGRYSSKNEARKNEYKRDRRVFSQQEQDLLATMSSDERMKYYKEKFTGNQGSQQVQKKQPEKKQKPKNKSGKKNYGSQQNKKQNIRNVNEKHPVHTENRQSVKNKKKSFFEKVASFFKK